MHMLPPHHRQPLGRQAEQAVVEYLRTLNIRIVERNLRLGYLELDIVAENNEQLIIVEVRARGPGSRISALQSLSHRKRQRIRQAGRRRWRRRYKGHSIINRIRYDVAAITVSHGEWTLEYIEAAF